MSPDQLQDALCDVGFTLPTPFSEDRTRVRYDQIEEHVTALQDAGARLFIPCGNTGEYYSLDHDERVEVVSRTVQTAGAESTVIGGVGGSAKTAKALIEAYESAGVDSVMVMHPSHVYTNGAGLLDYYDELLSATDLGVVIYKRGPEISSELLAKLSSYDTVVGVKYAENDIHAFSEAVDSSPGEVVWINGIAERFAPAFALEGAVGFTTGIGNFVPEATLSLFDALSENEWERARRIRNMLRPYENLRQESVGGVQYASAKNVPAVKFGMELRGWYGGPVRPPLRDLSSTDEERATERYEQIATAPAQ